ncbi:hypothetical protein LINGRAHAP2_LOCUS12259 [Linum grandiflorum]
MRFFRLSSEAFHSIPPAIRNRSIKRTQKKSSVASTVNGGGRLEEGISAEEIGGLAKLTKLLEDSNASAGKVWVKTDPALLRKLLVFDRDDDRRRDVEALKERLFSQYPKRSEAEELSKDREDRRRDLDARIERMKSETPKRVSKLMKNLEDCVASEGKDCNGNDNDSMCRNQFYYAQA